MCEINDEFICGINYGLTLVQKSSGLRYGTDALLLAAFAGKHKVACEFGSGCGPVSLMYAKRGKCQKLYALEIQPEYAALTQKNAELNGLDGIIETSCGDVRDFRIQVDAVLTNPPFMRSDEGKRNIDDGKYAARHEVWGTINEFAAAARSCLRYGGSFYAVYRPARLIDLLCAMRDNGIEPKRIINVYDDVEHGCCLTLVEGIRGGKPSLITPKPFILREKSGGETRPTEDMRYVLDTGEFSEKFSRRV